MTLLLRLLCPLLLVSACKNKPTDSGPAASEILENAIQAHGGEKFMHSVQEFKVDQLSYHILRDGHIAQFTVTRTTDTSAYVGSYKNGYLEYFVNDVPQEELRDTRRFLEARLEGFVYLASIPHVFKQNAVVLEKLEDIMIKKESYYSLHIAFREDANTMNEKSEFILYVNKNTNLVDFYAQRYELAGGRKLFKKIKEKNQSNGLALYDYWNFTSKDTSMLLKDYYKDYNNNTLEELNNWNIQDLKVTFPENKNIE